MTSGPEPTTPDGRKDDLPLWRKHFPVETAGDVSRSRREFVGGLVVAGGAVACGQTALNAVMSSGTDSSGFHSFEPLTLERKLSDMRDGEAVQFHYPDQRSPCLLVKLEGEDFVAFSQKCTHLACPVIPDPDTSRFLCPCHHGAFDLKTGSPVSGPPKTALRRVRIEVAQDGTLKATGLEGH